MFREENQCGTEKICYLKKGYRRTLRRTDCQIIKKKSITNECYDLEKFKKSDSTVWMLVRIILFTNTHTVKCRRKKNLLSIQLFFKKLLRANERRNACCWTIFIVSHQPEEEGGWSSGALIRIWSLFFARLALGDEAKKRRATLPRRPPSLNVNNVNHFRTCNKISLLMMLLGKYTKNYWWRARVIFALQIPFAAATASNPSNFSWCERGTPQLTKGFFAWKRKVSDFIHRISMAPCGEMNAQRKHACVDE